MTKIKRYFSLFLVFALVLSCFPAFSFANAESLEPPKEESGDTATLTTQIAESGSDFTLTIPKEFHAESMTASEFEPEYELLESICTSMGVNVILDYYALDISMPDVFVEYSEDMEASIHFKTPSIRSLGDGYTLVYAVNDGMIQRVKSFAAVTDKKITDLTFAINTFDSKTQIVVLTTDQPSLMLSASVNGNMAVQGISKVSFSYSVGGSSKSCSIQGITYHWVDNQQNPAYCLEPNKTFAYATNGGASSEEVGLGNSSSGRVGGNVWNALSASQRRAIALVALYGVPAGHWHSDGVAGSGNNTMYPTNANQCCFAAGQILVWEFVMGLRDTTAPYRLRDSRLIDNFDRGNVRSYYDGLVSDLQNHDSATTRIPSPEDSTYSLTWVTSSNQTVMSVELIQYITPAPKTVSVSIRKTSSNATGTEASKQFTFRVFSNSTLTSKVGSDQKLTPGRSFTLELEPSTTYYVAEIAEDGWECTTSGVSTKTVSGVKYYYRSITTPASGSSTVTFNNEPIRKASVTVQKTSANASGTNASKQFTFRVFSNSNLTTQVGTDQKLTPGKSFTLELEPSTTYYVAEVAEEGWECTTSGVSTKTVSGVKYYYRSITTPASGSTSVVFNNEPQNGITLQKSIDAPQSCIDQLNGNAMYSLAGAKYTISVGGVVQETLTTDANGRAASTKQYSIGTVLSIKETTAPAGFALDSTTYTHTVTAGTNTISVKDKPLMDPPFAMTKVDKATTTAQGDGSFHGAVFKWEYFDNMSWTGTAKRTWCLKTNESGRSQYDTSYLAEGYTSDALYIASNGSNQIPLGTVKITEVKNSLGYIVLKDPLYCSIAADASVAGGVTVKWEEASLKTLINIATGNVGIYEPIDETLFGSLTIEKVDAANGNNSQGAAKLSGAVFQIINSSANAVKVGDHAVAKPGEVCFELVTDANGRASTGSVLPLGRYTVRESKAPEGYALNTQWVQTFAVTAEKKDYAFTAADQNACPDEVIRGGIRIIKQNASLLEKTDENDKLEGITFSVISNNENPVVVGGKSYKNGETVLTMEIKWDGSKWSAESAADALPYGTYTIKENPAKPGQNYANGSYLLNEEGQVISVGKPNEIIEKTFLNVPRPGSIKVEKVDPNGKHLSGASFLLLWSKDGEKWARLTSSKTPGQMGVCTSENLSSGVLTTDDSGIVEFTGLDTSVQYRLVEVAAPEGYSLLTEKIFEGTLPVDNVNIGFRVVNAAVFELPQTGSMSLRLTSAVAALCAMMGVCIIMKRRKEQ